MLALWRTNSEILLGIGEGAPSFPSLISFWSKGGTLWLRSGQALETVPFPLRVIVGNSDWVGEERIPPLHCVQRSE